MKAFIISIGEELLSGQTVNTNAAWMASQLNRIGIGVQEVRAITDLRDEILRSLQSLPPGVSLVLMTGGLGPTRDDVTRDVLCRFFESELVLNESVLSDITAYLSDRGRRVTEVNRDQAMVLQKARVLRNPSGTAPGMWFERAGISYIAMPGVPYEMKEMMTSHILPALKEKQRENHIVHKTVLTFGIGESALMEEISDWEDSLPPTIQLAYLPSTGIVKLRLSAKGPDKGRLDSLINGQIARLEQIIPEYVWGYDEDSLEGVLGRKLRSRGLSLAAAESCTGGYLAHRISSVAGCSDYFKGSITAYHNAIKTGPQLGVHEGLIMRHGAVSKEVAEEMAKRCRLVMQCDVAIGVTGIAGPGGGSDEKPVGTTWIAVATENGITSRHLSFGNNRGRNIILAANAAMALTLQCLD